MEFWFAQREAIETLIYVREVLKKTTFFDLAREFGSGPMHGYDPSVDQYPLYAFKMATGSGKTFVMAMAIVWSYFNNRFENKDEYPSKFLLISPNIIVYERLKRDFEENKIFREWPFIPPEWMNEWNLKIILRDDPITTLPEYVLFLTNIQQLEERDRKVEIDNVFGLTEVKRDKISETNRIREVLTICPNIAILKDEAHHIYNFEKAWKKILLNLHKELVQKTGKEIALELDFSATPKTETGTLFPWIITDFTLEEAIRTNIVKRPLKGILKNAREISSHKAETRYKAWIDAGVERWREYKKILQKVGKRPILFIMCENTDAADEVAAYLERFRDLKGRVLLIHTNLKGDIIEKDLDKARAAARNIDESEEYDAIVSVLMLNEGWDVRNVTIIVGLRSYTSKRKVLPEQVIGRGLRKMFPDQPQGTPDNLINMLEVIGPEGLTEVIKELEKEEGITLATFDVSKPVSLTTILVEESRHKYNISIPIISPRIGRRQLDFSKIDLNKLPKGNFDLEKRILKTKYIAEDIITRKVVMEKKWTLPVPQNSESVISYYTTKILKEVKLPRMTNFPYLYPIVREYVQNKFFKKKVDLDDPRVLFVLSEPPSENFLVSLFSDVLKKISIKEEKPKILEILELKDTKPFVWSRQVYPANHSVFNYQPCENDLEVSFSKFLDNAPDIKAFAKLPERKLHVFVEYLTSAGFLSHYYPDFVALTTGGEYYFIETKGIVDIETKIKDARAKRWCEDLTQLTGNSWNFVRIDQKVFQEHEYQTFSELLKVVNVKK
ncbi:MAG: DEAD/DEAH box helicase family protein [Candidatus Micrarchaeia archaeon]